MDKVPIVSGLTTVVVLLICLHCNETCARKDEPTCFSRFDYDMKMFETVADMKHSQKTLMESVNKLQDLVETLRINAIAGQETIQKLEARGTRQQQSIDTLIRQNKANGNGGSYVRWGRVTCPANGTRIIYKGTVGGAYYSHSGSGADYQCLPDDPTWGKFQDGTQGYKAYMFGAEYEGKSLHFDAIANQEVPCAVCLTTRSTVIMIPARTSCYPGWTLEYEGNLASASNAHNRAQYNCVDKNAESAPGSDSGDQNGALFYAVEARCGSLHCPPYVEGRELACVVCSK